MVRGALSLTAHSKNWWLAGAGASAMCGLGKNDVLQANVDEFGSPTCANCKSDVVPASQSTKGVSPGADETRVDHIWPKAKGGDGAPENGQILCVDCNGLKSDKTP